MKNKSKIDSELEKCFRCKELSDLNGKDLCYWCAIETQPRHNDGDVYSLPSNRRKPLEGAE